MSAAVERAKEALEGVTDGPWRAVHVGNIHWGVSNGEWNFPTVVKADCGYDGYGRGSSQANAQFIAEARTLVPELVADQIIEAMRGAKLRGKRIMIRRDRAH